MAEAASAPAVSAADELAARHSCQVVDSHLSSALEQSAVEVCLQVRWPKLVITAIDHQVETQVAAPGRQ